MTTRVNVRRPDNAPGGEAILRSMFLSVTNGRAMNISRTQRHEGDWKLPANRSYRVQLVEDKDSRDTSFERIVHP